MGSLAHPILFMPHGANAIVNVQQSMCNTAYAYAIMSLHCFTVHYRQYYIFNVAHAILVADAILHIQYFICICNDAYAIMYVQYCRCSTAYARLPIHYKQSCIGSIAHAVLIAYAILHHRQLYMQHCPCIVYFLCHIAHAILHMQ